jgi:hypothetical protein
VLERIIERLERTASGRRVLLLAIALVCFGGAFRVMGGAIAEQSKEVTDLLDGRLFYAREEVYPTLDKLGPDGRKLYFLNEVTLDLVFPVVYTLLLSQGILYFRKKAGSQWEGWRYLALLPFFVMACDYTENGTIVTMISLFPDASPVLAQVASLATTTKWVLAGCSIAALVAAMLVWGWDALRASKDQEMRIAE